MLLPQSALRDALQKDPSCPDSSFVSQLNQQLPNAHGHNCTQMLLCWRARWSARRLKIQSLPPQVWAAARSRWTRSFTREALHRSRWKIIHNLLEIYWCQVFIPWFHFHCSKVTKQQNAVKCEYMWDNGEEIQKHQRRIVVWFVHLKQDRGNVLTTKLQDIESISLGVKGGGASTGSHVSGAPLRAVQVQPKVVSPSLHLQLVQDQIPVTSDTSWGFFRPLVQLCATLRLSRRSCNKCQSFGSGCYL